MKIALGIFCLVHFSIYVHSQNEPFIRRTVITSLNSPWEITYGPNDSLWVTENFDYQVSRINVANGSQTVLLSLLSGTGNDASIDFSQSGGSGRVVPSKWPQGGLMGLALHPALYSADPVTRAAKPWVYIAYVFDVGTCPSTNNPCTFQTKIVRYDYNANALTNPVIILTNIPGSNDHNSGRLKIGPDLKLYYTIGDMGAGQFNNASRTNNAQQIDVMEGKVLRLNTESDGDAGLDAWVPDDNPFYNASAITPQDYVYTMGHRNAQGLVWANVNGTNRLYASEHGDKTDDEINIITGGSNYSWNRASGYCDDNYNGMTLGGYSPVNESGFCTSTPSSTQPFFTMFTRTQSQINALSSDYLTWPSVAPSSIDYVEMSSIPGWDNSLLITTLKAGKVFRVKLNSTGTGIIQYPSGVDTANYFHGQGRFRDMAISPDGSKFYLACDITGQTSGPTGGFNGGGTPPPNAGSILEFSYVGVLLPLKEHPGSPTIVRNMVKIYPNPTHDVLNIQSKNDLHKPLLASLYDVHGRLITSVTSYKNDFSINIKSVTAGLYFLKLYNGHDVEVQVEKIIIK